MLERWSPRAEIERVFDEVDRMLSETVRRGRLMPRLHGFRTAVDVYETDDRVVVKAVMPGAKPEDLDVSLDQNTLTIRGRYGYEMPEEEAERVTWHCREIPHGQFVETLTLPAPVDADQVKAVFEDGILTLELPKTAETRAKHIPVRTVA